MGSSARSSFRASCRMSSRLLTWRVSVMLRVRTSKLVSFSFSVMVLPFKPSLARSSASFSDSSVHYRSMHTLSGKCSHASLGRHSSSASTHSSAEV